MEGKEPGGVAMTLTRRMAFGLAAVVAFAGCSTTAEPTTSETTAPVTPETNAGGELEVRVPVFADDDVEIVIDAGVEVGQLDNGLTYYIRENRRPGGEAQLRLAVTAGSAVEADDQRGVAHYLEHMLFNGTEQFPGNELVRVLERFGAEFGPDVNAFTSYDQTVYELSLPSDPDTLATAFVVLFEWAARATLDPTEVDAERGVLVEEWRLRSQSFFGRYGDAVAPLLLAESPYAGHDPLATPAELEQTSSATLRRFYEDWYRPELMGIVAVGDFDSDDVRDLIDERFGSLTNPPAAPALPDLETTVFEAPMVVRLADPELTSAFVELNYPRPQLTFGTVGAFRESLAEAVAWDILVSRLTDDIRLGLTPFLEVSFAANPFVDGQRTDGLFAFAEVGSIADATESLLLEVQRAVSRGFAPDELERSIDRFRTDTEAAFLAAETKQDWEYAAEYLDHFLTGYPAPSAEEWLQLNLRLLEEMTPRQVTDTFRANVLATHPLVILGVPAGDAARLPSQQEVLSIVERVRSADPEMRNETGSGIEALMERPEPGRVVDRSRLDSLSPTVLTLSNGVRVAYLSTDIAANFVSFEAFSPGGWLLAPPEDAVEAQLISDIVAASGVAGFDPIALDRFLLGSVVNVFPYIGERGEGLVGDVETGELETLMQLIHLYMTAPRLDEFVTENTLRRLRQEALVPDANPFQALANGFVDARFGDDRYRDIPAVTEIDTFDPSRALTIFRERFFDADDFVFAFAGDFRPSELEDLAAAYLGSLPSVPGDENPGTGRPAPPEGTVRREITAGSVELGAIQVVFTSVGEIDFGRRMELPLLESILDQRLTALLREELGATYSPFVSIGIDEVPPGETTVLVEVVGDPAGLDAIEAAFFEDLSELRQSGPTRDQLLIAKEQVTSGYEFVSNQFWLDTMLRYTGEADADPGEIERRISRTEAVSGQDIRRLAIEVLPEGRFVALQLVPEG